MKTVSTSSRVGGFFLLVAGISMPIIIIDYIVTMSGLAGADGPPTLSERADFVASVFDHLQIGWHAEVVAMALLGAGALSLINRASCSGWALCAMGCIVTMPMYALMVGGYGAVLSQADPNLELFEALLGTTGFSFHIGQGLTHLGLGIAFFIESLAKAPIMPRWFFLLAAAANTFTGVVFSLIHTGTLDNFMVAGPFGLLSYLVIVIFGLRLLTLKPS